MRDPTMAAATLVGAQSEAMVAAAKNESTGPMMAFAGMNMAAQAGGANTSNLFAMGQQQNQPRQQQAPAAVDWKCECGSVNTGKFCANCGKAKPKTPEGWSCSCGSVNKGKFCSECGQRKPPEALLYQCDKCGWEPKDKTKPPKFCPECGDIFDDNDTVKQ